MRAAMRRKKLFLLDMDGTLYLGDRVFDHCLDFLRAIRRQGGRRVPDGFKHTLEAGKRAGGSFHRG